MKRRGFLGLLAKGAALAVAAPVILKTVPFVEPTEPSVDQVWCGRCGAYHSRRASQEEIRRVARERMTQWWAKQMDDAVFQAMASGA